MLLALGAGRPVVAGVAPVLALGGDTRRQAAAAGQPRARGGLTMLRGGEPDPAGDRAPQKSVPVYMMMPLDTLNGTTGKLSEGIPGLLRGAVELGAVSLLRSRFCRCRACQRIPISPSPFLPSLTPAPRHPCARVASPRTGGHNVRLVVGPLRAEAERVRLPRLH